MQLNGKKLKMMYYTGYGISGLHDPDDIDIVTGKKFCDVRSKQEYGYSYDEFLQWELKPGAFKGYGNDKEISGAYSDRLFQWDSKKYNEYCRYVFNNEGQYWNNRNHKDIEKFLRLYFEDNTLILQWIIEGCNPSNGYPYWVFGYKRNQG
jgi:hypothetical protein